MKELIIMVGPQGSGKTTYSKKRFPNYLRISSDEQGRNHKQIFNNAIKDKVEKIIVDKTNPTKKIRKRFIDSGKSQGYIITIIWLDILSSVCKERILKRTNHETLLPEKADEALNHYFSRFEPPKRDDCDMLIRIIK